MARQTQADKHRLLTRLSAVRTVIIDSAPEQIGRFYSASRKLIRHGWRWTKFGWKAFSSFMLSVASVAAAVLVGYIVFHAVTQRSISIEPITVPKALAESGLTPTVAADRIRDNMYAIVNRARSSTKISDVRLTGEQPEITVPVVGSSVEAVAGAVATYLHWGNRRTVSGEIQQHEGKLWLTLRIDHHPALQSTGGVQSTELSALFQSAAEAVLDRTEPSALAAAAASEYDTPKAFAIANRIIDRQHAPDVLESNEQDLPSGDPNVVRAYILRAGIQQQRGDLKAAENDVREALKREPQNPAAHTRLGAVLYDAHNLDAAEREYREAMWLDRRYANPHNSLGNLFYEGHNFYAAEQQYREAIRLDRRFAVAHSNLGNLFHDEGKRDAAEREYREAIRLNRRFATPHIRLGNLFFAEHKLNAAEREYREAMRLDPRDAISHNNLGTVFRTKGKRAVAEREYRAAIRLNPRYAGPHFNLSLLFRWEGKFDESKVELRAAKHLQP